MDPTVIDPQKDQGPLHHFEATHWTLAYESSFTTENNLKVNPDVLKYMNCSYCSTPGRPPTLEALKRHAKSLAVLIALISPPQAPGEIDNANSNDKHVRRFVEDEAFDWLNNLSEAYSSGDASHHRPLNSLLNQIREYNDLTGIKYHCPLEKEDHPIFIETEKRVGEMDAEFFARKMQDKDYDSERQVWPYARHRLLLMHVNECLEMLDHEFSATGGLLSILPTSHANEIEQFQDAKETILGQWLHYTQHLVSRMHELEQSYANSLDLLAGEAAVPMQHLSVHGPDGRSGREMVFPQDRWILANAGDDVLEFFHYSLDKKEEEWNMRSRQDKKRGVVGQVMDGVDERERGIVHVDISTRFYRLKGDKRGPIFVLPAYQDRPDTTYTREIEKRPTVITLPAPTFPERISEWAKRTRKQEDELLMYKSKDLAQQKEIADLTLGREALERDAEMNRERFKQLQASCDANGNIGDEVFGHWEEKVKKAELAASEATARADKLQRQLTALMPNQFSWQAVSGALPRDADGNITDKAMQALLEITETVDEENKQYKDALAKVQEQIQELDNELAPAEREDSRSVLSGTSV